MLYTAQYRYSGRDRLDITVKGKDPAGKVYAPTWNMVMGVKRGIISEETYTDEYYRLLLDRWHNMPGFAAEISKLVEMVKGTGDMPARDVTLVCFCPAESFCHRYLLVNFLKYNYDVPYGGERSL
jgi:hypothetical protein